MHDRIGLLYLERLGADDVELLGDAARRAGHRDIDAARLHAEPNRIIPLLSEHRRSSWRPDGSSRPAPLRRRS